MKTVSMIMMLALAATAHAATGVYTNVNGMAMGLVFQRTTVEAGDYVGSSLVLSNASTSTAMLQRTVMGWDIRDFGIGDYVVTDEKGNVLPKVVWALATHPPPLYKSGAMGIRMMQFPPGATMEYPSHVVKRYALTNPGVYQVKAIAEVPVTNHGDLRPMVIETPPITLTVIPRAGTPIEPLYSPEELAEIPKLAGIMARVPPLTVTHPPPKSELPRPSAPTVASREGSALPATVQAADAAGTAPDALGVVAEPASSHSRSRNVYYGLGVLLLVGGVVWFIWRSRRHQHP